MSPQDYIERVLKPHVLPWVQANYPELANYVFMQDGALCHKANVTQQKNTPRTPAQSSDFDKDLDSDKVVGVDKLLLSFV